MVNFSKIDSSLIPKKNKLRILLFLLGRSIIFFPLIKIFQNFLLPNAKNSSVLPGIFSYYGNVISLNAMLSNTMFIDYGEVSIGENTVFGFDCIVITSRHSKDDFKKIEIAPVVIGANCYFGPRCIIFPGVVIGDGCTIAAGSVVMHSIKSGQLVAGVPGRVIASEYTHLNSKHY